MDQNKKNNELDDNFEDEFLDDLSEMEDDDNSVSEDDAIHDNLDEDLDLDSDDILSQQDSSVSKTKNTKSTDAYASVDDEDGDEDEDDFSDLDLDLDDTPALSDDGEFKLDDDFTDKQPATSITSNKLNQSSIKKFMPAILGAIALVGLYLMFSGKNEATKLVEPVKAQLDSVTSKAKQAINAKKTDSTQEQPLEVNNAKDLQIAEPNKVAASKTDNEGSQSLDDALDLNLTETKAKVSANQQEIAKQKQEAEIFGLKKVKSELDKTKQQMVKAVDNAMDAKLTTLINDNFKEVNTKLQKLEALVQTNTKYLNNNKKQLDSLRRDLNVSTKMVQNLIKELKTNKTPAAAKAEPPAADAPVKAAQFTAPSLRIHAVIPGRAWLKNAAGDLITVTEGDEIAPYGRVLGIDAPSNAVITSSGVTLR